ncbi:WG repeat-containing protein [Clostridium manihotivorum]|uniref:WG repeat-containing protein n=1 Tax=Clostridium manihotivorum TaxID=2320868 RepID=A0A3R5QXS3_9CLOT|nr:WG repeat-containing protein [Clostridium manihotivorum]QAA35159.1 hypothetical protein C1I91_27885 [Clostridium manihotivorum]
MIYKFLDDELYGFINEKGEVVVEPQFLGLLPASEGFIPFYREDGYGFISYDGKISKTFTEFRAFEFYGGLSIIESDGLYGFMDKNLNIIVNPYYDGAMNFSDGLALVEKNGKKGYIDTKGNIRIPLQYEEASSFSEGLAVICYNHKMGYINTEGDVVINPIFSRCGLFSEGLAIYEIDGKYGYLDKKGNIVIPPEFDMAESFSEGFAIVMKNKKLAVINKKGEYVTGFLFDYSLGFSEERCAVGLDKKGQEVWGYINTLGKPSSEFRFDNVSYHNEGLAVVQVNNKCGYIDLKGQYKVKPSLQMAFDFEYGLGEFLHDDRNGYLDKEGNVIFYSKNKVNIEKYAMDKRILSIM